MEEIILQKRFGDISEECAGLKKSKVCIIQAPYDETLTYIKGARKGPEAIIEASTNMELFDDELQAETYKIGIYTAPPLEFNAPTTPEKAIANVKDAVKEVFDAGKFPVLLGGEHSITVGAVKAAKEAFNEISVLHLDAHYDLRDEYNGSKYNHACVARRLVKICPIVEVGVRNLSKEEKDFLDTSPSDVKVISVYDILDSPDWKKEASGALKDNVYITIDLDVLDPAIMPSVGTPEPGGFGWYEFMDFLKIVTKDKKIIGFDVVELSPKEGFIAPDFLAAKIIYRLLGYIFNSKK
ncbi:MAG: agmatinase [Candidatus Omnitrophica bacterium]|nr:agmatinase [Candidatus Omnitrophota bacterium]